MNKQPAYDPPPIGCNPSKSIYPEKRTDFNTWIAWVHQERVKPRKGVDLGKAFEKLKKVCA